MTAVAKTKQHQIARPLKVLIPKIQAELQLGNEAGREHYTEAGRMLNEARPQVSSGRWTNWLTNNFELSPRTAGRYMRWAEHQDEVRRGAPNPFHSLSEMEGDTERRRKHRQAPQQKAFEQVLRDVAREDFLQERQTRDDEMRLHRELAAKLIDLGYRALAIKLHSDRGGSDDAMARLNRVRDELKQIAQTRRFV